MRMMKVRRYWTGRAPEWAEFGNEEEEGDILMVRADALLQQGLAFPKDVGIDNDSRLLRLADTRIGNRDDHRRIRQVEIVSTYQVERGERELIDMAGEEEEEGVLDERRERIKERMRMREKEVEAINATLLSEEEEEEGEEEEDYTNIAIMKPPMYVHKDDRETVAERKRFEAKEEAIKENARKRLAERKVETKQVLVEEIWKEQMIKKNQETEVVVDVANSDHEAEYEAWKLREVARIKRDRKMMEEEKRECESRKPEPPPRKKMRFLQKRYHKGAFFQDEADDPASTVGTYEILKRDFSAPTGEDKMDKTILPKVMQVKHFGRRGRVKWSHLVNEDTTNIGINLFKFDDLCFSCIS